MPFYSLGASGSIPPAPPDQPESARQLVKDGRPLAVLIVEDDPVVGEYFSDAVQEFGGHIIGVAAEPSDAFGLVVEHRPDVVIMDVRLKNGHDGLHAADAMRLLYRTPIVFCTGCGDAETIRRIEQFGGCEYLLKPVLPEVLRDALLRACGV
jgi:two-component system, response regulator PdtaR